MDWDKFGLRALTAVLGAVLGLAASVGQAGAQYYPPGQYSPPPPTPYGYRGVPTPGPDYDDDDAPIYSRPPAAVPNARGPAPYGNYPSNSQPYDPRYGEVDPDGPPPPYGNGSYYNRGPAAGAYNARPDDSLQGMRPPGALDQGRSPIDTGSNQGPVDLNPNGTAVASLPPDYQPEEGELKELPPNLRRQLVDYQTAEPAGTIIIDTPHTYLYLVLGNGKALRYGIGVGREGFTWTGRERISRMAEWPDWIPPKEMIERQPYLPRFMAGGPTNPLGARALYLGNSLYRIHGTNQPSTIGSFVSSGCIRLTNADIEDLYGRVQVGTRVVVLPGSPPTSASAAR
jgi:lipoprotein-anchoring transpeptidase ErfK/SrfK